MIVDQHRNRLYSTGKDTLILCQDLETNKTHSAIKTNNCRPYGLEIDTDLERLYVSTREGLILIFDVKVSDNSDDNSDEKNKKKHMGPYMIHCIKPLKRTQNIDFVKQMDLDRNRNALICRSKAGLIICIQIMNRALIKSAVIETINSYECDKTDSISRFNWLSRMSCYCEGTTKGCLKIRTIEKAGETILML